jgi:hypothetical protein
VKNPYITKWFFGGHRHRFLVVCGYNKGIKHIDSAMRWELERYFAKLGLAGSMFVLVVVSRRS